jgi:GT2 family glycosyltransferase
VDAILKGTPKVILIVPVLNRYDLLQRMIWSIDHPIDDLLIIDNGEMLTTIDVPNIVNRVHILNMPNNLGVASSWNLGIKCFPFEDFWTITSADTQFMPGALKNLAEASKKDSLTLTDSFPHYQAFSVGSELVQTVGLFDESIHPIYFEDNDYQRRVAHHGFEVVYASVPVAHDNSSTIHSDPHYRQRNGSTFSSNERYYNDKVARGDFSEGRWDLQRVRNNSWHK